MFDRLLKIDVPPGQSTFLWGPRLTGKSTLLKQQFPQSKTFDLLNLRVAMQLTREPYRLSEEIATLDPVTRTQPILIDEIQRVPVLLDEVHRLIESEGLRFVMCASSARKLLRGNANLLGGRAWRFALHPLSWAEIPSFDLMKALSRGLIPNHYESPRFRRSLSGYTDIYLKEEVFAEGLTRNVTAFSRFLEAVGFSHGELVNFSNIARDCGVDSKTVREYFQILVDTLLGVLIEPYARRRSRDVITRAPKFYLFDVGIAGQIIGRRLHSDRGIEFGHAFEHFILMELMSYRSYREADFPIRFWRTKSKLECDFVLGTDGRVVIDVKGSSSVKPADLKGLRAFNEEYAPQRAVLVCNESSARLTEDGILILPWEQFLEQLWSDDLIQ